MDAVALPVVRLLGGSAGGALYARVAGMKRWRPHIPLPVRVAVAGRQLLAKHPALARSVLYGLGDASLSDAHRLRVLLAHLFDKVPVHLDHDPPLRCRKFNPRTGKYTPAANDPAFLVYRTALDHRTKTFIRGEHGQHSDRVLIKRERRREKGLKITGSKSGPLRKGPTFTFPSGPASATGVFVVTAPKLRSGSKWPPKGSRPLRSRPFQRRDV